jgi:Prophage tail length tape measure protein
MGYRRRNPIGNLTTEDWVLVGVGAAVVGTLIYAAYSVQQSSEESQGALADAQNQVGVTQNEVTQQASQVQNALEGVQTAAQQAQSQIQSAQQQAAPVTGPLSSIENWWNSL